MITFKKPDDIIYECIVGSKSYGLDLPSSDTDIKGVYVASIDEFYGFDHGGQLNNDTNDISYYEIGKFLKLLTKSNPTVLEMLFTSKEHILHTSAMFNSIEPARFLSKKCKDSFASYAIMQIKKARGLNKKISNPLPEKRKSILDFCHVLHEQGSVNVKKWLTLHNLEEHRCGLTDVKNMENMYGIYYDNTAEMVKKYRGLVGSPESMDLSLSSVFKSEEPIGHLFFNKQTFSKYCREYREYWDWVRNRNEERYNTTIQHGKNYDSKNLMHTFRLLDVAEDIAKLKTIQVKRPNREELLKIRKGDFDYDELIRLAEIKIKKIDELFEVSDLPEEPDYNYAEELLVKIRKDFYTRSLIAHNEEE
jgi:hypothetical protein